MNWEDIRTTHVVIRDDRVEDKYRYAHKILIEGVIHIITIKYPYSLNEEEQLSAIDEVINRYEKYEDIPMGIVYVAEEI